MKYLSGVENLLKVFNYLESSKFYFGKFYKFPEISKRVRSVNYDHPGRDNAEETMERSERNGSWRGKGWKTEDVMVELNLRMVVASLMCGKLGSREKEEGDRRGMEGVKNMMNGCGTAQIAEM